MFCPSCGSEERTTNQFCRTCGTDLRVVRTSLGGPDSVTASAVSAREEIGRAVAQKIREIEDTRELKRVADHVLPQIEKFLESAKEKRLRRVRSGVILAASGVGGSALGLIMSAAMKALERPGDIEAGFWLMGLGVTACAIGVGFVLNGLLFTEPRAGDKDSSPDNWQNLLEAKQSRVQLASNIDGPDAIRSQTTSNLNHPSSVTDHTTLHLKSER